jgi:hypothetical protein
MRSLIPMLLATVAMGADTSVALIGTRLVVTAPADALPAGVEQQLTARLTMRWQDTPLTEVADLIRLGTGVNIVVDPKLIAENRVVTLTADGMDAANVLRWIGRLASVHTGWRNGAVYLAAEALPGTSATRTYDVADILHGVPDYPGPEIEVPTPGGQVTRLLPAIEPTVVDDGAWLVGLVEQHIGAHP